MEVRLSCKVRRQLGQYASKETKYTIIRERLAEVWGLSVHSILFDREWSTSIRF